jgi:TatD DNase family protein
MAVLDRWHASPLLVLHSFDGTPQLTDWAIERGCYIGVGGLATKPRSGPLRQLLAGVPLDRLLLETDAPYLSPPTAKRRNEPANLPAIAEMLGPLWDLSSAELARITTRNAVDLFQVHIQDAAAS